VQVTILDRNLEIIPIYYGKGWDISALKEPGVQVQVQEQPKDTGPGWDTHVSVGVTIDVLNVSRGRWEVAITGSAGYDFTDGASVTGGIGGKVTLHESDRFKVRLYAGVAAEKDFPTTPGVPDPSGFTAGGGLLIEINPFAKKKK
jgi:hypothetical protein